MRHRMLNIQPLISDVFRLKIRIISLDVYVLFLLLKYRGRLVMKNNTEYYNILRNITEYSGMLKNIQEFSGMRGNARGWSGLLRHAEKCSDMLRNA